MVKSVLSDAPTVFVTVNGYIPGSRVLGTRNVTVLTPVVGFISHKVTLQLCFLGFPFFRPSISWIGSGIDLSDI